MNDIYKILIRRLKGVMISINEVKGKLGCFEIQERADEEEIKEVEDQLGYRLPKDFRKVIKQFSKKVDMYWRLPHDFHLPDHLQQATWGGCYWNLAELVDINNNKNELVKFCFSDCGLDDWEKWYDTLAFFQIANGDYLVLDLNDEDVPVRYISHELDAMHGWMLANSFIEFLDRWTKIACVGPEDWVLKAFIDSSDKGINPNCENSKEFRNLIGWSLESTEGNGNLDYHIIEIEEDTREWFEGLLGYEWERKYEIVIEDLETKKRTKSVIPAINGGRLSEDLYRDMIEKEGKSKLISFNEYINKE